MSKAPHPIEPLLAALADRTLTADERTALADLLRDDPDARALYRRYLRIHLLLDLETGGLPALVPKPDDVKKAKGDRPQETTPTSAAGVPMYRKGYEPQPFKFRPHHYALAAAALIAACGLATYLLTTSVDPEPSPLNPPRPLRSPPSSSPRAPSSSTATSRIPDTNTPPVATRSIPGPLSSC